MEGSATPLPVIIADDHRAFRSFVAGVLTDHYADLLIVAATCPVSTLSATWGQHQPALVLLDLGLPGMTSLGLIADLRAAGYRGWIIMLSMEDDPPYVAAALTAGADALLGKGGLNTTLRPTVMRLCQRSAIGIAAVTANDAELDVTATFPRPDRAEEL